MAANGLERGRDRAPSTAAGAEVRDLAGRLRALCEQPRFSITPALVRTIADCLESIARNMSKPLSDFERDQMLVMKVRTALAIRPAAAKSLVAMLKEPGKPLSIDALKQVLGSQSDTVVPVYMSGIRAALREKGFNDPIHHANRIGYTIFPGDAVRIAVLWQAL